MTINQRYLAKFVPYLFAFALSCLAILPVQGHEVRPSYLELVQLTPTSFSVLWKVPAKGNQLRLGLDVEFADDVKVLTTPVAYFAGGSYIKKWQLSHRSALQDTMIAITGLDSTFTEALVRIEWLDGQVQLARLMPESPRVQVTPSPSPGQVAKTYSGLGIKHILLGFDHLLFLLCLLFIAGRGKRLLITISGFTIAHSITLALATLDIVSLRVAPVEAIIALSIVFLASEIVKGKRATLTWNYPISVAGTFGLLHGFGFAAMLSDIGLPQTEQLTALLFFNIGVEVGQLAFVVAVLMLLNFLVRLKHNLVSENGRKACGYLIGSLASFWLIERSAVFL